MRHLRKTLATLVFGVVLASMSQFSASAGESPRPENTVARVNVGPTSVGWSPTVDYERLVLTIVGPEGFVNRQELEAGQTPSLSLFAKNGERLPDGIYTYELRPEQRLKIGKLPEHPLVQSGYLTIRDGNFVDADLAARAAAGKQRPPAPLPATPVLNKTAVPPPLIVAGNACIGDFCTSTSADFPNLKLKSDITAIKFENDSCCSPSRDWVIRANDLGGGGGDRFSIQDWDAGTVPFSIAGGLSDNALYVGSNGNLGLGTATPAQALHVIRASTPTIRLEQPVSPGPARTWDVGAHNTQFFVRDVTNSSALPLQIQAGAPTSSIYVTANGRVGFGTANPLGQFHVAAGEVRFPPGNGTAGWTVFNYQYDGNNYIRGTTIIADTGGSVGIGTTTPSSKLHVNGGDIRVSGGSFIDDGVTLNAPDYVFESSYKLMPLEKLKEFVAQERHLPNVPNAREVKEQGLNLSQFQMRLLEKVEELTLYTLTQNEQLSAQQEQIARLAQQNAGLLERLAALEKALPVPASQEP